MSSARQSLERIFAACPTRLTRIMHLSGHQERTIAVSGLRAVLPTTVRLLAGPGCAASGCPEPDLYQAMQLVERHGVTLLVAETLLQLPLNRQTAAGCSLIDMQRAGRDIRPVETPDHAVMAARAAPDRDMVYFAAGFETLAAPLAAAVLDGLPDNLTILLCGRRIDPLLEQMLTDGEPPIDALLLPANRCALTGYRFWEELVERHRIPAAITGYTGADVLTGVATVLEQIADGQARVENCYRALVHGDGSFLVRDQLERVFERGTAEWRGLGQVSHAAFQFRHTYRVVDANHRYPDYRAEIAAGPSGMPNGCECAAVLLGRLSPEDCPLFSGACSVQVPYGPCMASDDGTCFVNSAARHVA